MRKIIIAFIAILWAFAGFQIIQGKAMAEEDKIIEVFHTVGTEQQSSTVEYYGDYVKEYLPIEAREELLRDAARRLGIIDGYTIERKYQDKRQEVTLYKEAKLAKTTLRFITAENGKMTKQYIIANISLDTTMESAMAMKAKMEDVLDSYTKNSKSSANVTGLYEGKLNIEERNEIAADILGDLGARMVTDHRDMQLYTIYAYTTYISDYVMQEDNAINVNIAMRYNEDEDKTYVYVAVPVLGVDY